MSDARQNHAYSEVKAMIVDPSFIPYALDMWRKSGRRRSSRWFRVILAIQPDGDDLLQCLIEDIDRNPVGVHDVLKAVTKEDPTEPSSKGHWVKLGEDWKKWWEIRKLKTVDH